VLKTSENFFCNKRRASFTLKSASFEDYFWFVNTSVRAGMLWMTAHFAFYLNILEIARRKLVERGQGYKNRRHHLQHRRPLMSRMLLLLLWLQQQHSPVHLVTSSATTPLLTRY
jgi:hypothetical protein